MDSTVTVERIRRRLADSGVGAFAVCDPCNIAYVTGFDGVFDEEPAHIAVVDASQLVLLTDARYIEAATAAAQGGAWEVRRVAESLWADVSALTENHAKVAVEDTVPYRIFVEAGRVLSADLEMVTEWVETLRIAKSDDEIARINAAVHLTDLAFEHIVGRVTTGVTERHLALELEYFMRANGSDGLAFPPIVASGPNSALPHAMPTERTLQSGDFLKMDFGARVDGYCADMTRTVVVGRASDRQREIYATVLAANRAGIAAVREGQPAYAVDAAARSVIEAAGYGAAFTHSLGHGVGRQVHELPSVSARSTARLAAASVVTIEPGIYLEGFGGVRIEDSVVVEPHGARVLTTSTKELLEL